MFRYCQEEGEKSCVIITSKIGKKYIKHNLTASKLNLFLTTIWTEKSQLFIIGKGWTSVYVNILNIVKLLPFWLVYVVVNPS